MTPLTAKRYPNEPHAVIDEPCAGLRNRELRLISLRAVAHAKSNRARSLSSKHWLEQSQQ